MFPWLSQVASAYEKYRFEMLEFEIIPRNPTSSAGAVYSAVDYDWDDTPATTTAELMSNRGAVSSDVWSAHSLKVDTRRLNEDVPWRYVAELPRTESSQRLVYSGFFMLAIAGTTASVNFDVFARYRVRLSLPCLHTVDSTATITYASAVTVAAITHTPYAQLPVVSGLSNVLAGVGGVPTLGVQPSGSPAYRLPAANKGEVSITAYPATAGNPPSNYVTDTFCDGQIYDAVGNLLGYLNDPGILSANARYAGPDAAGTWATNGAVARAATSFAVASLRKVYPLAVYLVPTLYSSAGRVLSTSTKLSTRYTEV